MSENTIETQKQEISFEEQTEILLTNCTDDQLKFLENAIYAEKEFRVFSFKKVRVLKEKLKEMERDFNRKMKLKKELLEKQIEDLPEEDESFEESEEELPPAKKKKQSPSKKNKRKN